MKFVQWRKPKTLKSKIAYAQWAASYPPVPHNPLMTVEQEAMLALMPDLYGCVVADLGCGSGRYCQLAYDRDAETIIGIDNSDAMLRVGLNHSIPARFLLGTVDAIPLDSSTIDVGICAMALGHLPEIVNAMREISRVLKPDGVLLVSDFHHDLFADGAQRTFQNIRGETYAVEHYVHLPAVYKQVGFQCGLALKTYREAFLQLNEQSQAVVAVYEFQKH